MQFESIGKVVSDFKNPRELIFACERGLKTKTYSEIVIKKKYAEGLNGIGEFSHVFVIYFLHQANKVEVNTHPGPPDIDLPRVGVFASRSQYRPNHLALRLVRLKRVKDTSLFVEGLDAINGSRVVDIKPYVSGFDRPEKYKIAEWYRWLD